MNLLAKYLKRFFGFKAMLSPLKVELSNLRKNVQKTYSYINKLERDFWTNGGVCCPFCGVPGFTELTQKQERRLKRIKEIEAKLEK